MKVESLWRQYILTNYNRILLNIIRQPARGGPGLHHTERKWVGQRSKEKKKEIKESKTLITLYIYLTCVSWGIKSRDPLCARSNQTPAYQHIHLQVVILEYQSHGEQEDRPQPTFFIFSALNILVFPIQNKMSRTGTKIINPDWRKSNLRFLGASVFTLFYQSTILFFI